MCDRRVIGSPQSRDHQDLHQSGSRCTADTRLAMAGRCAMNTLREAVGEYLDMRRGLGFKLQEAGKGLIDFITFLEQHNTSYITQALALVWAQQPSNVQPAYWAQRLSFRPRIRTLSQCH